MNESDVIVGDFYWVWVDASTRNTLDEPPALVVAQPWRIVSNNSGDVINRLMWEACGTDEGVRVLSIVSRIEPPPSTMPREVQAAMDEIIRRRIGQ